MFRRVLSSSVIRRQFATESNAGKLVVNFSVPHKAILQNTVLNQVNLSTTDGDMGILAGHVPIVVELKPSVVTLIGQDTKKFFVSGGFAIVNPDSSLNINAVEAVTLDELDQDAAKRALDVVSKQVSSSNAVEAAEAQIQVQVLEAVLSAGKA